MAQNWWLIATEQKPIFNKRNFEHPNLWWKFPEMSHLDMYEHEHSELYSRYYFHSLSAWFSFVSRTWVQMCQWIISVLYFRQQFTYLDDPFWIFFCFFIYLSSSKLFCEWINACSAHKKTIFFSKFTWADDKLSLVGGLARVLNDGPICVGLVRILMVHRRFSQRCTVGSNESHNGRLGGSRFCRFFSVFFVSLVIFDLFTNNSNA